VSWHDYLENSKSCDRTKSVWDSHIVFKFHGHRPPGYGETMRRFGDTIFFAAILRLIVGERQKFAGERATYVSL